jgi:hypothetical protein
MKNGFCALLIVSLLFLLLVEVSFAHPPNQEPIWEITSPLSNAQLRGTVQIMGSAYLGATFERYQIEYQPTGTPEPWRVIGEAHYQEVRDGLLGVWDTTTVADGQYNLRLRVVKKDGNYEDTPVRRVVVANFQSTPTPTPTETSTPVPLILASPTVMVVQPTSAYPTTTPMPPATRTPGAGLPETISLPGD